MNIRMFSCFFTASRVILFKYVYKLKKENPHQKGMSVSVMNILTKLFGSYSKRELKRIEPIKEAVLALDERYTKMSDEELKGETDRLKGLLAAGSTLDDILPEAFAACREAMWRVLSIKPFPVQIIGGIILHQGRIS